MKTLLIYVAIWPGMVLLAILNGAVREKTYGKHMGELAAHQLSTGIGALLFGLYIWGVTGIYRIASSGQALLVGVIWLAMTVLFEFLFGRFAMGHSWRRLLQDYNLLKGRIWPLLLAWILVAPSLFFLLRQ